MEDFTLVIGNRNYSSWSLRAWLALAHADVEFETVLLPLDTPQFFERIGEYSPSGRVPVLWHDGVCIWDSLAIGEYVNEQFASGGLWPEDSASRAMGRSMASQMHSSFIALRNALPMNIRASRVVRLDEATQSDINRVFTLWADARAAHADGGPFLLGQYTLLDAMFAPVVSRFKTYDIALPDDLEDYGKAVLADTAMVQWTAEALQETDIVDADEAGEPRE